MELNNIQRLASDDHSYTIERTFAEADALLKGRFFDLVSAVRGSGADSLKVLDIGCGKGRTLLDFVKIVSSSVNKVEGTGIDINDISEQEDKRLNFVEGDAQNLPFDDNSFDVGYSVATLQYLEDPLTAILEAQRVIKPGGVFLWQVTAPTSPFFGRSFKQIRDASPDMQDSFTVEPGLIFNHVPQNKAGAVSTPFLLQHSFRRSVSRVPVDTQAEALFNFCTYGTRRSITSMIMDKVIISDERKKRTFMRMGLLSSLWHRGKEGLEPSEITWEKCVDETPLDIEKVLQLTGSNNSINSQ